MKHTILLFALISAGLSISNAALGYSGGSAPAGLYVYARHPGIPQREAIYDEAVKASYIDGFAVSLYWKDVEPQDGHYDWSKVDPIVEKLLDNNKKLSFGLVAGIFAPEWLYEESGVQKVAMKYNRSRRGAACSNVTIPVPWSKTYIARYRRVLDAFARHLKEASFGKHPAGRAYEAVSLVKITGINMSTEESYISSEPPGGPCDQDDATALWKKAGFRPYKLRSAWKRLSNETAEAFRDKRIALEVIEVAAFPPIDNKGAIYSRAPLAKDDITSSFVKEAVSAYGSRLMVKWNALNNRTASAIVTAAGSKGAIVGWQMNNFLGDGSGCIYHPWIIQKCNSIGDYQSILENGIKAGGRYIEVHPTDVDSDHAPAFENARKRIYSRRWGPVTSSPAEKTLR